jgi:hypothetical protein
MSKGGIDFLGSALAKPKLSGECLVLSRNLRKVMGENKTSQGTCVA